MKPAPRIDHTMSAHKFDSELLRINPNTGTRATAISSEMFHLLAHAEHFSQQSDGAFDNRYPAIWY